MTPPPHRLSRVKRFVAVLAVASLAALLSARPALAAESDMLNNNALADAIVKAATLGVLIDRDLPRDTFDVRAAANQIGNDPDKIFAWVRDNTAYVPYRGSLRGPVGVLLDRSGNSLDRSLLLARLLQIAGQQVRLAHGTLPDDKSVQLLKSDWEDPKSAVAMPSLPEMDDAAMAKYAMQANIDPATIRQGNAQLEMTRQKKTEDLIGTVVDESARLAALVGEPADSNVHAAALQAIGDHWWVQRQQDGKWIDLDPITRDAKPGDHSIDPAQTVDLPNNWDGTSPDVSQLHEVELRVVVERLDGKNASTTTAFHQTLRPATLAGQIANLQIIAADWPGDLDLSTGDATEKLRTALLAQQHWIPILFVGNDQVVQGGFDSHGVVDPHPPLDSLGKTGKSTAGAASAARDAFGGPAVEAASETGQLTGVWLEIEIRVPGEKPQVYRRSLFDAFGPALRAAGNLAEPPVGDSFNLRRAVALYRQTAILPAGYLLSEPFVTHQTMEYLAETAPLLVNAVKQAPSKQSLDSVASAKKLPGALLYLGSQRRGIEAFSQPIALGRPNVFLYTTGLAMGADGKIHSLIATDIVANEVEIRGLSGADQFKAAMTQGVLETALEPLVLQRATGERNTTRLFADSQTQHIQWVKLASADDPQLSQLKLNADTLARIREELGKGYVVVAPTAAVSVNSQALEGWWRVDPRTGACIGFAADGTGSEIAERGLLFVTVMGAIGEAWDCWAAGGAGHMCIACAVMDAVLDVLGEFTHLPITGFLAGQGVGRSCFHDAEHHGGGGDHGGE